MTTMTESAVTANVNAGELMNTLKLFKPFVTKGSERLTDKISLTLNGGADGFSQECFVNAADFNSSLVVTDRKHMIAGGLASLCD